MPTKRMMGASFVEKAPKLAGYLGAEGFSKRAR
jgi:hypothetical protein